jgi:hypothetical protein
MNSKKEFLIRNLESTDLDNLINFFKKAYGKETIFRNVKFLQNFFSLTNKCFCPMSACVIGLNSDGEIVAHYGGMFNEMKLNNSVHTMFWGVNAYTLKEWRGKGINSAIINHIIDSNIIHGVIGFTKKTAIFYEKIGYNVFNFQKFVRYVLVLDHAKAKETVDFIKQDNKKFRKLFKNLALKNSNSFNEHVVKLTSDNIGKFEFNLDEKNVTITTTHRTLEFITRRILENSFIKYEVFGFVKDGKLLTYIVLREEVLSPLGYKVNRIVDLYGKIEGICALLDRTIHDSILNQHIYIDFSMFGAIYNEELTLSGFMELKNDDYCLFPQVTAPIENRPNCEYIGFFSKNHSTEIRTLKKENVYFTRIDSDRDRLSKISQLKRFSIQL